MLWKKLSTQKTTPLNSPPPVHSSVTPSNQTIYSMKGIDKIYHNINRDPTASNNSKQLNIKKGELIEIPCTHLQVDQTSLRNTGDDNQVRSMITQKNKSASKKLKRNSQPLGTQGRKYDKVYSEHHFDHLSEDIEIEMKQGKNKVEDRNEYERDIGKNEGKNGKEEQDRKNNANRFESAPVSVFESGIPHNTQPLPEHNNSKIQQKFKANSMDNVKKSQRNKIQTGFGKMTPSQLEQNYHDEQLDEYMHLKKMTKHIKQSSNDQIDDFIKQMQQAGIDVADLQSNGNQFSKAEHSKENQRPFSLNSQDKESIQNKNSNGDQIIEERSSHRNILTGGATPTFQYTKKVTFNVKESSSDSSIVGLTKKQLIYKLREIKEIIEEAIAYKSQIMKIYGKMKQQKLQTSYFVQEWTTQLRRIFNNMYEQQSKKNLELKCPKDDLKLKVLQLESRVLEKQVQVRKLNQEIAQLKRQNQELRESLFEANQKIAQAELQLQQKLQDFIKNYQKQLSLKTKTSGVRQDYPQKQIRRLNQEVEELTRLYENSQEQHKRTLERQRQNLEIQVQRICKKEVEVNEKEKALKDTTNRLKAQQGLIKQKLQKNNARERQLMQMQNMMKQKMFNIEYLQKQLNEQLAELEKNRKEAVHSHQKCEQQIKMLKKQKEVCHIRIEKLLIQKKQLQEEVEYVKKRKSAEKVNSHPFIAETFRKNKEVLTQYQQDDSYQPLEIKLRDQIEDQYTFMKTQRSPGQDKQRRYTSKFTPRDQPQPKNLFHQQTSPRFAANRHIKTENDYQRYSQPMYEERRYSQYIHVPTSNYRNDPKYMSQAIILPSPKTQPTYSITSSCKYGVPSRNNDRKQPLRKNLSPKLRQIFMKSKSSHKMSASRLNQLDNKIEMLRNQIKKEVDAAKNQE